MIGILYRYPHPHDPKRFIYCGQGAKRDVFHRLGFSSFGRRFKELFPNDTLPEPIKQEIEVYDHIQLNEEETIWMFQFHTWWGYADGMNLTLPGSVDYKELGRITGRWHAKNGHMDRIRTKESCAKGGRIGGRVRLARHGNSLTPEICKKGGQIMGPIQGRKNVESGQLASIRTPENWKKAGEANVRSGHMSALGFSGIGLCFRWNIKRGKVCICGKHKKECS